MRIVLDTNVLVSALLSPHRPPGQVLQMLLAGRIGLCYDARILDEYHKVVARPKFPFSRDQVSVVLESLESAGELVAPAPLNLKLPDPDDAVFLEVAVAASADHLVTGNLKHFPSKQRHGVSVIAPAVFVRLLAESG
jgi:putative PIN family toxin of toxin-antitoxin system